MGSFIRLSGIMAVAGALAGTALMAAPAAQATTSPPGTIMVPCAPNALAAAITTANLSLTTTTLVLPWNCTYNITTPATVSDGLPVITGHINLMGANTVIRRTPLTIAAFRILDVAVGGSLSLTNISVQNGSTTGLGGGIQNAGTLQLSQVTLSGNTAGNGGGLANAAAATANIFNTVFDGNTTTGVGGGGIINSGTLTMAGSTLSGNHAPINGGGLNTQSSGISQIRLSNFLRNVSGGLGGGISNLGTTTLQDTRVQLNTGSSGGGIATGNANLTLRRSTVTNNSPDNCNPLNTVPGCVN